ncbi:metallophosphoesterase [Rhodohalobacter sp. 8-1]|uniref:metallophosphoesterase n=1 Tax=Rhodohalobacter sp. 8-1 TaxID=3131972 RepID=UPI0030EE07BC
MKLYKQHVPAYLITTLFLLVTLSACSSTNYTAAGDTQEVEASDASQRPDGYIYSLFLIGDAGDATLDPLSGSLRAMGEKLAEVDTSGAVVFLGDNIYPHGLPPEDSERRPEIDERLLAQIETVKDFGGPVYFIPGNHDWESSGEDGLEYIRRQEDFVEERMGRGNSFLPDDGYPGPVSVTLLDKNESAGINYSIGLIIMDTHWWIHPHDKPLPQGAETEEQAKELVLNNLAEQMSQFTDEELVFSAHHPLYSFGRHGSKFPLKTHLMPPVFGSAYALYRNMWGYPNDITHKHYSRMKEGILAAASDNRSTIFVGGHEHSLSFIPVEEDGKQFHQIVSGSGTRSSYVRKKDGPVYTYQTRGFAILRYYPDRSKRIEFYNNGGEQLFDHPFLSK